MSVSARAIALAESANHRLAEHLQTVAELAVEVADELGVSREERYHVELAALLHDIGKVGLMEEIMDKPGGLTLAELDLVKQHPVRGQAILEGAGEPLARIAPVVRSCHERWDGGGYPDGLAGDDIPLIARIVFCCDAYDAITSDRPYSAAMSHTQAIAELWSCAETQFDPDVVAAVVRATSRRRTAGSDEARPLAGQAPAYLAPARASSV